MRFPACGSALENGFGKSGKQQDQGQSVEKQAGQHRAGIRRIINMSSIGGQTGNFGQANSTGTKESLIAFAMTLAREVARKGITVSRQRLLVLRIIDAFGENHERSTRAEQTMVRIRQVR